MSEENLYQVTPRETRKFVERVLEVGLVPFVRSSPGMGKSSIMHAIAKTFNLELIDIRLSTCAPEDLSGLPEFFTDADGYRRSRFVPFEMFPLLNTRLPEGKDGWMVFYDEMNSGTKMVQAASYKVILDRLIGQMKLHDRVVQCGAGNLVTDRAIVNNMSTAMQSRLIHFEMKLDYQEWYEDIAIAQGYDERIQAFINYDNKQLMDFRPDHNDKTFNCPRTWEFMNKLIKDRPVTVADTALYAGTITSGSAATFVSFCQLYKEMLTIKDVLADPENAKIPETSERKWIIATHLVNKITDENFGDIATYMGRMDLAHRITFFRTALHTHQNLKTHPRFAKALIELSQYLKPRN